MHPTSTAPDTAAKPTRWRRIVLALAITALVLGLGVTWLARAGSSLVRPRVSEVLTAASSCREAIAQVFDNAQPAIRPTFGNVRCDVGGAGRYAQVRVDAQGAIHFIAQGFDRREVDGHTLLLVPFHDDATPKDPALPAHRSRVHKWVCTAPAGDGIPDRFLPGQCRGAS